MDGPPPPCGRHVLKLCINSHVAYHVPLRTLLLSLQVARFEHFSDVLVMLGGSTYDAAPQHVPLAELVPDLGNASHQVVVVRTRSNAFDYHGLGLLHAYRMHPLVRADMYVYCHDTSTVDPSSFLERFESFRLPSSPLLFTTWPLPNSNTVAFGAGVVRAYGHNFDGNLSDKTAAFPMEFGYPFERPEGSMRPLVSFGFVVKMGPRLPQGSSDVYKTGIPRLRFYYPAFGLSKHSMRSDSAGDILGKRHTLFAGGRRYFPPGNASKLATVKFASRPSCWARCRETALSLGGKVPLLLPSCAPVGSRGELRVTSRS